MSGFSKDSAEVIEFMTLFARLKRWCDDAPQDLVALAGSDDSVQDICFRLFFAAHLLRMNERRSRVLFAAPVDPAFQSAWRDYEARYEAVMASASLPSILSEIGSTETSISSQADLNWAIADDEAEEQTSGIRLAFEHARYEVENSGSFLDPEFASKVEEGVAAWDRLTLDTGFDLRGVFRRRALIPFILVPRHVAAKHGSAEKFSLLRNLQQAQDAFVFGATYPSLALMRSIMESVLRNHYRVKGENLSDRIHNARDRLPPGAGEAALHRLRKLANAILHLDPESDAGLTNLDEVRLEKEIVSLLFVLRELIEGAG